MNLDGKLEIIGVTDVGRKRAHNEDSIGSDTGLGIAVLADGMGGYRAGEVASAMAVNMILDDLREGMKHGKTGEIDDETGFCRETLLIKTAIEKANATIYQTAQRQPQCQGMGTTVVARGLLRRSHVDRARWRFEAVSAARRASWSRSPRIIRFCRS